MRDSDQRTARPRGVRETALSDEAIEWLVRLGSGRSTAADAQAFVAWRRQDPEHEVAAREAEALLQALGDTRSAAAFRRASSTRSPDCAVFKDARRPRRRALLGGAAAAAAALVLAPSIAPGPLTRLFADYATGIGERRRFTLPDGSNLHLNTASAVSMAYSATVRKLSLDMGEALFEVAKEPGRPFVVVAGPGETRAIGTAFTVRRDADDMSVTVTEGVVDVSCADRPPVRVAAGQGIVYGPAGPGLPEPRDVDAASAWDRGKLIFNRRPLAEVVVELERYRVGRIVIADPSLGRLQVTGVFDLDDLESLLRTLEKTVPIKLIRFPLLTIVRQSGASAAS
jgi:transmembrane sensor